MLAWLNYMGRQHVVPMMLAACMIHELGHYLMIRALGGNIRVLRITVIGAEMELSREMSYGGELLCALAGPAASLAVAYAAAYGGICPLFSGINLALGLFNLLPVGVLDGGRALFCLTAAWWGPDHADRVITGLGRSISVVLFLLALVLWVRGRNWSLLFVSSWLMMLSLQRKNTN